MKNKLEDLNNALFMELEMLQDEDSFKTEDGEIDAVKMESALKRADKISNLAGRIMEVQRLQLETLKFADKMGYKMEAPESLKLGEKTTQWISVH